MTLTVETPTTTTVPVEKTTKPKFSELIRLGSLTTKQGFRAYSNGEDHRCALGAGFEAAGIDIRRYGDSHGPKPSDLYRAAEEFGLWNLMKNPPCEHAEGRGPAVYNVIIHLNDYDKWSREAIADWLETEGR